MPALLIRTCNGSPRARKASMNSVTEEREDRSSGIYSTRGLSVREDISLAARRPVRVVRHARMLWRERVRNK